MSTFTVVTVPVSRTCIRFPETTFTYDSADPFAVTMTVATRPEPIRWRFARDLLVAGMTGPAGIGDVRVAPFDRATVVIDLSSPDGSDSLYVRRRDLVRFLAGSGRLVPRERANPDLDAALFLLCKGRTS